jgi:LysM repeat protein
MKSPNQSKIFMVIAVLALTSIVCVSSSNNDAEQSTAAPLTAELSEISGTVQVMKPADGQFKDAVDGQTIVVNDQVLTHQEGRVRIELSNGTFFRLSPLTTFVLEELEERDDGLFARLMLEIGELWIILKGGAVNVDTPSGLASVRGSYLHVSYWPDTGETYITCLEGECSLENLGEVVKLVAGQTAIILNADAPPVSGKMSDDEVEEWLNMNPESTQVIISLTETVAANEGKELPQAMTATPTENQSLTLNDTPTPSATAFDCGPPSDWVDYTAHQGDTLEALSAAYRVSIEELQHANCMGTSTAVTAGDFIFVPNVPTTTPTFTATWTPTLVPTKVPPINTATFTPTPIPSNLNAVFFNPAGPKNVSISSCLNYFKTDVKDPDGIVEVKMYYIVDDNRAGINTKPTNGSLVFLTPAGGDTYEMSNYKIDSWSNIGTDDVYYQFYVKDSLNFVQYSPIYKYTDSMDCGKPADTPAGFTNLATFPSNPDGVTISTCQNNYQVDVIDADGVTEVYIYYSINDAGFSSPAWQLMTLITGNTWDITTSIPANGGDTVYWKFKSYDGLGYVALFPASGSFSFTSLTCP